MQLIKTSTDEKEILEILKTEFGKEIASDMMKAVKRNGMSAYGRLMVRQSGKSYLLLKLALGEEAENA